MSQLSLYQALLIFSWFPLAFTLAVIMLIARFYERFSATRTYWWLYAIPVIGYAGAVVREAAIGMPADPAADALQAISGGVLIALTSHLSLYMLRHKATTPAVMAPPVLTAAGLIGPLGLGFALFMLARFTRRMVTLNRQPPYHRLYYVAVAAITAAAGLRLAADQLTPETLILYALLIVLSTTAAAVASWRTWSWLLAERA